MPAVRGAAGLPRGQLTKPVSTAADLSCPRPAARWRLRRLHVADANALIEQYCLQARSTNPLEMAGTLISHPSLAMHGPEHHFLVPAVLLAAYHQLDPEEDLAAQLKQARKRAEGVKGGSCGFCGNCGAAVGTGIFVSLITGASPLAKKGWQLANRMTAESLLAIAEHGGPRCCKRDTFLALQSAQAFLSRQFDIEMELTAPVRCDFSPLIKSASRRSARFIPITGRAWRVSTRHGEEPHLSVSSPKMKAHHFWRGDAFSSQWHGMTCVRQSPDSTWVTIAAGRNDLR
jgi:hypothetical protein